MIQLISFIIFIVSFCGLVLMLYVKIPAIANLPKNGHHGIRKPKVFKKIEKKIKDTHFHVFKKQVFLHKLLSKTKIWILKTETKIDKLLHRIRKNVQELEKKKKKKNNF